MVPRGRISGAEGPHPQPADRQKAVSVGTAATRARGRSISTSPWKGRSAAATSGTTPTGRRSRGRSGSEATRPGEPMCWGRYRGRVGCYRVADPGPLLPADRHVDQPTPFPASFPSPPQGLGIAVFCEGPQAARIAVPDFASENHVHLLGREGKSGPSSLTLVRYLPPPETGYRVIPAFSPAPSSATISALSAAKVMPSI